MIQFKNADGYSRSTIITWSIINTVTEVKHKPEFILTKDTPYLTLMGELWKNKHIAINLSNYESFVNNLITFKIWSLIQVIIGKQSLYHNVQNEKRTNWCLLI